MPDGVTVAQLILVQFVEVRILVGQPTYYSQSQTRIAQANAEAVATQPIYYSQSQTPFFVLYVSIVALFSSFYQKVNLCQ